MLASSWLSVCPSIWKNSVPTGQICMTFYIWVFFEKLSRINVSLKSDKETGTIYEDQRTFFIISRLVLHRMRSVLDINCRENRNTHCMFNTFLFCKSCPLWDNVEKYCWAGQATDDNLVYVHCLLDTLGYKHTLKICNTHCFSTATVVAQMLYIHTYIANLVLIWVFQIYYFWQERQCRNNSGRYPEKLLSNFFTPFLNVTAAKFTA
jgi:hypothetical protein